VVVVVVVVIVEVLRGRGTGVVRTDPGGGGGNTGSGHLVLGRLAVATGMMTMGGNGVVVVLLVDRKTGVKLDREDPDRGRAVVLVVFVPNQ
jgi:hypothetical protein